MTKDEALRMALEALEQSHPEAYRHVITAIKEALAQPEQEPVAWITKTGSVWKTKWDDSDIPLYTTPPQRTWVGLTDEEVNELVEHTECEDYYGLVEATEAKLKEKTHEWLA